MKFYCEYDKKLYNSAEECAAAEEAFVKAENEKVNSRNAAIAELDSMFEHFEACRKQQDEAMRELTKVAKELNKKYYNFQRTHGNLPDKHYSNFILTRLL